MTATASTPGDEAFFHALERLLPIQGSALDVATGTGRVALWLAPNCEHVVGVDVDPSMIEAAQWAAARAAAHNVSFHQGDVETVDIGRFAPDEGFRLATARLFFSPVLPMRLSLVLAAQGAVVAQILTERHWHEAGGSRFGLAVDAAADAFHGAGFTVTAATEHERVTPVASIDDARQLLKRRRLWTKWRKDGRWATLRAAARKGTTLTDAHAVIVARRTPP